METLWHTLFLLTGFLIGFVTNWYMSRKKHTDDDLIEHVKFMQDTETIIDRVVEYRNKELLKKLLEEKEVKDDKKL